MASKHIIVIGAGISGLTAAFRLQRAGHAVSVFEARQRVGGRMITIDWKGFSCVAESQVEHVKAAAIYDAGGQGGHLLS